MSYFLFAVTLLISSTLLFLVQPMVAKMLLPILGGSPAVWNTSMVFFQAMLLLGYFYAHATTRWLGSKRQSIAHMFVMLGALLVLPIAVSPPQDQAVLESPVGWLLLALLLSVGWPFFVISTSAPLLQTWFSNTDHPHADDPYHLYAASNIGSVVALLTYPFLIEPYIGLLNQTKLWAAAYLLLVVFVGLCAVLMRRNWKQASTTAQPTVLSHSPLSWSRRGRWILWGFVPSSMMLGLTTFITTDIAPIPLLWIAPLALYLMTFVLVFARRKILPMQWIMRLFPIALIGLGALFIFGFTRPLWAVATFHFAAFFIISMVFHGLLAEDRPVTFHLTEFFLWMSVGGVLGGAFNAMLAPMVFDRLLEYPLIMLIAVLSLPISLFADRYVRLILAATIPAIAVFVISQNYTLDEWATFELIILFGAVAVLGVALFAYVSNEKSDLRVLRAILIILALAGVWTANTPEENELFAGRSFYGVHTVKQDSNKHYHSLVNGTTSHGTQSLDPEFRRVPIDYYNLEGPLGQVFELLSKRNQRFPIAAVGLGTGVVAAYTLPGQEMDFYEIDPEIARVARNPEYFTYLQDCKGRCDIILGDGRLQIERAPQQRYELIILDAYSSTAIPIHLMTLEAVEIYLNKLQPDGILAFHISNNYLNLEPALTRLAERLELVSISQFYQPDPNSFGLLTNQSFWLIMARDAQTLGPLINDKRWEKNSPKPQIAVWTDDYSNILQAFQDGRFSPAQLFSPRRNIDTAQESSRDDQE